MKADIQLKHIALQFDNKKHADIFFNKILGLKLVKSFNLTNNISEKIFGIKRDIEVIQYANENSCFEIFLTGNKKSNCFDHVCIEIENKNDFITKCKYYNIEPFYVEKADKLLLFIKDFNGNLYEIKVRDNR